MSDKFIKSFLNGTNRNHLKEKFRNLDLSLLQELNEDLYIYKVIKGTSDNNFIDMNRLEFQDYLDDATFPITSISNRSITSKVINVAVAPLNPDESPIKGKIANFNSTPNNQAPDILYKLISTQNSFLIFTSFKNLSPNANYFFSRGIPEVSVNKIISLTYYGTNFNEIKDDFGNRIGWLIECNSLINLRRDDGEGNISESTIELNLQKVAPKFVKYIDIITRGFTAYSPRGIIVNDGNIDRPIEIDPIMYDGNKFDWSLIATHASFSNSLMEIRSFNGTELLANNLFLQTIRNDNFSNNENTPDSTFSLITSRPNLNNEFFELGPTAIDPNTLQPTSRYNVLVTNHFRKYLKNERRFGSSTQIPIYKNIYSNPFYVQGIRDELFNYPSQIRTGNDGGNGGDYNLSLIGNMQLTLAQNSLNSINDEENHPFSLSGQRIFQDYVIYRNFASSGDSQDSFYVTQLLENPNFDFNLNYANFFNTGYSLNGFVAQTRWPNTFTFSLTPNSYQSNLETDGVFHMLINKNIYEAASDISNESNNNYDLIIPSIIYQNIKAHNTNLNPIGEVQISLPTLNNFIAPLKIDFDKFDSKISTMKLVLPNVISQIINLKIWKKSGSTEIIYYDINRNIISREFRNTRLDSPNNLEEYIYV